LRNLPPAIYRVWAMCLRASGGNPEELRIECDFNLPGVWELGRKNVKKKIRPFPWSEFRNTWRRKRSSREAASIREKLVSGLAQAAQRLGAAIFENARVENISYQHPLELEVAGKRVRAGQVLIATNAESLGAQRFVRAALSQNLLWR